MGKPSLGIPTKVPSNTLSSQDGEGLLLPKIEIDVATDLKTISRSYLRRVVVSIFISFFTLSLGLALVYLYLKVRLLETKVSVSEDLPEFCMECSELYASSINNQVKEVAVIRREEDKLKCCAKTPEQYTWLMKKMQDSLQLKRLVSNVTFSLLHKTPVAAHMLIGTDLSDHQNNPRINDVANLPPVHNLLPTRSLSLLSGVKLQHDRLIVQTKGIYLVYSQIYFKLIEDVNWPDGLKIISHIVDRYNDNLPNDGEEKLLQSVHTLTEISTQRRSNIDFHSSYISGVFELDVGDEIYTRVTSRQIVSRDPTLNYIGLVMLSDPLKEN
ncbi:uncharacterized protein LOC126832281 isoform X2 [Patella vulgata]|uniref:uncharacterized protein LOC126832281 isoform X2 n=1 Tax=Patella vulgata TaxID=6465 RepID=UPI002180268F|nr:uncharacterized protein LOC126832281 isoform X2 [Patella vulgata]